VDSNGNINTLMQLMMDASQKKKRVKNAKLVEKSSPKFILSRRGPSKTGG
jgi:hypothetical protein